jgi:hypothetical protein
MKAWIVWILWGSCVFNLGAGVRILDRDFIEVQGQREVLYGVNLIHPKMTKKEIQWVKEQIALMDIDLSRVTEHFNEVSLLSSEGENLNLKMIEDGIAIWDPSDTLETKDFLKAQNRALLMRRGLWAEDERFKVHMDWFFEFCRHNSIKSPSITMGVDLTEIESQTSWLDVGIFFIIFFVAMNVTGQSMGMALGKLFKRRQKQDHEVGQETRQ